MPGAANVRRTLKEQIRPYFASRKTAPSKPQIPGSGKFRRGEKVASLESGRGAGDEHRIWTPVKILLVATCTASMILNIACQNSASIGLPIMGRDFKVREDELQWIVSAYSLSSGCLLIFIGRLADLYGRKKAFLLGMAWLAIFSVACGLAKNIIALDILRAFQGLGAAAFVPASLGILAHAFPVSRARSVAFATFSAGAPIGGGLGMQLGGVLTQWSPLTWRAPFFLCAGIAVLILIGGWFAIEKDVPSTERDKRVDWIGAATVTVSLSLIQFVLGQAPLASQRWNTPYIIASLVVGILLLFVFLGWQYYLEHLAPPKSRSPLMKLSMWRRASGKFAVMQCIAFLEYAAFQSWLFWSQLYYQNYAGYSIISTAIRFLPMPITGIFCSILIAYVVGHVDVVILVVIGTLMTGLAGLFFAVIIPSAPYWAFGFPSAIVAVFGADFVFPSGTLFVAKVSMPHEQSVAGGLFQTLTQLGTALGLAITTIVHDGVLRKQSTVESSDPRKGQLSAYKAAQWTVFALGVLGATLAAIFLRGIGPVGHRDEVEHLEDTLEGHRNAEAKSDGDSSIPSFVAGANSERESISIKSTYVDQDVRVIRLHDNASDSTSLSDHWSKSDSSLRSDQSVRSYRPKLKPYGHSFYMVSLPKNPKEWSGRPTDSTGFFVA